MTTRAIYRGTAVLKDEDAQRYGERLQHISEQNDGVLLPVDVVKDARKKRSPLHDHFEWDDNSAAESYRLMQAKWLIRHINVVIRHDSEEEETRAFHNVVVTFGPGDGLPERVYVPLVRILQEEDLRQQVIERACQELQQWRARYKQYKEFDPVVTVIAALQMNKA